MDLEHIGSVGVTIGGGFFAGMLIGYALKKVVKIVAVLVGLFFAGLAFLQSQQIFSINWNRVQATSENAATMLANTITQISTHLSNVTGSNNHAIGALGVSNFGIPLIGSISFGFAIGFMRG